MNNFFKIPNLLQPEIKQGQLEGMFENYCFL